MARDVFEPGIVPGRLEPQNYTEGFSDLHPPLDEHEALVAADRCYFCHDAPCMTACPTDIDIPLFIRQIATGTPEEIRNNADVKEFYLGLGSKGRRSFRDVKRHRQRRSLLA